ncbi:MAG TPA: hypothetical protein VFL16_15920 [Steroidobacteraceae bacterium]|nr:hypothetical protein [Steroidobacteraceae bacterium]
MNDIARLLPHAGDSILIERVVGWDAEHIRVATTLHRSADNPLRRHGHLAAVNVVEFAAQAMALHGGLRGEVGRPPRAALLVSVRDLVLRREYLEKLEGELEIVAHALMIDPQSWQYGFTVLHSGSEIASGRIAAMAQAGD